MKVTLIITTIILVIIIFGSGWQKNNQNLKDVAVPKVSPIQSEWVNRDGEELFRITYRDAVLEIPKKYNPSGIDKKTKAVYFSLVWPSMTPVRKTIEDKYTFRVLIYPHDFLPNRFDDEWRIDNLIKNKFLPRVSIEYPPLLEYWNEEKKESHYFKVSYQPKVLKNFIACNSGYRDNLIIKEKSELRMGDTSCSTAGELSKFVLVTVNFDARLLPDGQVFHQTLDQFISKFIVKY